MKIAYTSDIHIDITKNNHDITTYLVHYVNTIEPDLFVIAGDCANSLADLESFFQLLKRINADIVFVPGNHDVWIESNKQLRKGKDSFYKYAIAIKELCRKYDIMYPIDDVLYTEGIAIIGTIGWYDYSLQDDRLRKNYNNYDYEKGDFGDRFWNDAKYAVWLKNPNSEDWQERRIRLVNEQVFDCFYKSFTERFSLIPKDIENILVVMHTAPFKECIVPKESPSPFDAYEGSIKYGRYLEENHVDRNIYIICGHRHNSLHLDKGGIQVYRSPIGYLDYEVNDPGLLVEKLVGFVEI